MITKSTWAGLRGRAVLRRRQSRRDASFARLFVRFALTGFVAVVVIGAVAVVLIRRSATSAVIRDAKALTQLAGRGIVEPLLSPAVLGQDPAALHRLDQTIHHRILAGTSIVRVKIWDSSGRIVYSDASRLIGRRFPLGRDELAVLRRGAIAADASDLERRENRTERVFQRLVEVYAGIRAADGTRLLYEDYERSSTISASSRRQWEALLPALGGALVVLYLIQLPLAYSLARRLRSRQRERERLLKRAIESSDLERRRIAADLHDGAVQRLAGVSLSLAAASTAGRSSPGDADGNLRATVSDAAAETRETIRELRTLLVDIYPPNLRRSGLAAALADLVAPLRADALAVTLDVPEDADLREDTEALFYRIAQEAIRNARTHGEATQMRIELVDDAEEIRFSIHDDGRGFSHAQADVRVQDRHFGLRLMRDLVDHAGGTLEIASTPGRGTSVTVRMAAS